MTKQEAQQFIADWAEKHPGDDLVVQDGTVKRATRTGKRAVDRLIHYDLQVVYNAAADAALETKGYRVNIARVFAQLKEACPTTRTTVDAEIPPEVLEVGDNVVRIGHGDNYDFGLIDRRPPPCLWVLKQRFWMGTRMRPEWTVTPPDQVVASQITDTGVFQTRDLKERWWKMELQTRKDGRRNEGFETSGPWWLYCPHDGPQRSAEECFEILTHWTDYKRQQKPVPGKKGEEPQSIAEIIMPGPAKKECISPTTGAKYVPGSAIGETPEGERLF